MVEIKNIAAIIFIFPLILLAVLLIVLLFGALKAMYEDLWK